MAGKRLLRLWAVHARLELLLLLRSRRMVLTWLVADVVMSVTGAVGGMLVLAARFDGIGAWTLPQTTFLLGFAVTGSGIASTFFNYNVFEISRRIGRGQLDHTLLAPAPIWMTLATEGFSPVSGLGLLAPGVTLLGLSIPHLPVAITLAWVGYLVVNLVAAVAVTAAISYAIGALAFWAPAGAEEISFYSLNLVSGLRVYPLDGMPSVLVGLLTTALPIGFVAWIPSRALTGLAAPWWLWATPCAALVFASLAVVVFRKGLRHYGHTGSQRYLDFGHRR